MSNYLDLLVTKLYNDTDDAVIIEFRGPANKLTKFRAGQFITLFFRDNSKEIKRAFSICSIPEERPIIRVAIKLNKNGATFRSLINKIKIGDKIKALPPLGNFTRERINDNKRHLFFWGAGSGISPLFSMIKSELINNTENQLTLFYANRNENSVIFDREIKSLEKENASRFKVYNIFSQPIDDTVEYKGRIDSELLSKLLHSYEDELAESDFFICGPSGFNDTVTSFLTSKNIPNKQIHTEKFIVKLITDSKNVVSKDRLVTLIVEGEKHEFTVPENKTIMDSALENGIDVPCKCKSGKCGTCRSRLLSGILLLKDQTALDNDALDRETCLTCVGYPASENVVIFYEDEPAD